MKLLLIYIGVVNLLRSMSAERHYTYGMSLFDGASGMDAEKFVFGVVLALVILFFGSRAASRVSSSENIKSNLIPKSKFSLFSFFDIFVEGFIKFHDFILGKVNRKYMSISGTVFYFYIICKSFRPCSRYASNYNYCLDKCSLSFACFYSFQFLWNQEKMAFLAI